MNLMHTVKILKKIKMGKYNKNLYKKMISYSIQVLHSHGDNYYGEKYIGS